MGDRGNIIIEKDGGSFPAPVFFYTHWSGSEMKEILKKALIKGRSRWNDETYLARVIFQELIGDSKDITGFGISTAVTDNEHPYLCLQMPARKVVERTDDEGKVEGKIIGEWSFEEFVKEP